jgi:hypothetical protein
VNRWRVLDLRQQGDYGARARSFEYPNAEREDCAWFFAPKWHGTRIPPAFGCHAQSVEMSCDPSIKVHYRSQRCARGLHSPFALRPQKRRLLRV